jgi:glycosyltransferase involved in cell wall biosynthesis
LREAPSRAAAIPSLRASRGERRTLLYVIGVVPDKVGFVERFAREMALQLGRHGWSIVLCFEGPPVGPARAALELPNVTLEVIEEQTVNGLRQAAQFARLVARHRPAVVVYAFNSMLRPYPWIARALSARRVYFNDHSSRSDANVGHEISLVKRLLGRAITAPIDRVICVSGFVQRCVRASGLVGADRAVLAYNGVDPGASAGAAEQGRAFRARHAIPPERQIVLQVSWMTRAKGIDKLLHAAKIVLAEAPDTLFVLVGEGEQRAEFEGLAGALGIADHVLWTGVIRNPTEEGVYAAADVCCQISQWHEAFGMAIVEAMIFSRPVVATRIGGIPELVRDGETGFVVDRDDVPAVAARILELLRDDALRARLGAEGRRIAEREFDLSRTIACYLDIFGIDGLDHDGGAREPPKPPADVDRGR